jgi:hypothetical protein
MEYETKKAHPPSCSNGWHGANICPLLALPKTIEMRMGEIWRPADLWPKQNSSSSSMAINFGTKCLPSYRTKKNNKISFLFLSFSPMLSFGLSQTKL